jgi:MFS family permease
VAVASFRPGAADEADAGVDVPVDPLVDSRAENTDGPARLRRDRLTVTLYGSYMTWGWLLYSFSPSVTLLARDQRISLAQAGLHGTAMAVGGLVAAFVAPRVVLHWGRRTSIVAACLVVAVSVVALVLGPSLPWTLSAMAAMSVGGNVMIAASQVGLALHHGTTASAAITEANGSGSGVGLLGPLAVGAAVSIGWGWRPAVLVTALLAVATALAVSRLSMEATAPSRPAAPTTAAAPDDGPRPRVPAAALFLLVVVTVVALENASTYWSTALIIERTGAGAGIATATTAGLVLGMTIIRFVVGPLSLRIDPAHLLAGSFAVAVVGWAMVWTTTSTAVGLAGLFVTGLGFGVQYPLTVVLLLAASPGRSDRAQGQATMAGALAIGIAPFLLGALADRVGMHTAFLVVPVLAVVGGVGAVLGRRALRAAQRAELAVEGRASSSVDTVPAGPQATDDVRC